MIPNISSINNFTSSKSSLGFARNKYSQFNYNVYNIKHNYKNYIQSKLKNKNVLYDIYLGRETGISEYILNNQDIMLDLYRDSEFLNASVSALKMIIEDKLSSNELSQDDRANLILWHNIFTMQEAFYNDSSNSFVTDTEANITTNSKYNRKNIKYAYTLPILQPSFGSIFNYGFFNKPKTRKQKAEALVNRYATATAAESALLLHVATPEIETGALTATTIKMCHHICKTYEMSGGAITALAAQVSGQLAGKAMANYGKNLILKLIPDAGNAINATTTYAIHEMQGRAIIEWCEKNYRNKEVADWDKLANGFRLFKFFCSMGPNPADVLGEDGMQ